MIPLARKRFNTVNLKIYVFELMFIVLFVLYYLISGLVGIPFIGQKAIFQNIYETSFILWIGLWTGGMVSVIPWKGRPDELIRLKDRTVWLKSQFINIIKICLLNTISSTIVLLGFLMIKQHSFIISWENLLLNIWLIFEELVVLEVFLLGFSIICYKLSYTLINVSFYVILEVLTFSPVLGHLIHWITGESLVTKSNYVTLIAYRSCIIWGVILILMLVEIYLFKRREIYA